MGVHEDWTSSGVALFRDLKAVGVDVFRFAIFPEGERMKSYNQLSNPDYFLTGFSSQEALASGSAEVILGDLQHKVHPVDLPKIQQCMQKHISQAQAGYCSIQDSTCESERVRLREDASKPWHWFEIRSRLRVHDSDLFLCEGVFSDVTELVRNDQEHEQSGLPNRRGLRRFLFDLIHSSPYATVALVSFRINDLEEYEVCFGSSASDFLVGQIGAQIQAILPEGWTPFCLSRNLYVLCGSSETLDSESLQGVSLNRVAHEMGCRFRSLVASVVGSGSLSGVSVGVAVSDKGQAFDPSLMIRRCCTAAFMASRSVDDAPYRFSQQDLDGIENRLKLIDQVRSAISQNNLFTVFQPQCYSTGVVFGVEALVRMPGGPGPDQFIPLAEQTGAIVDLGLIVMEQCLQAMQRLKDRGLNRLSFNVSAAQFPSQAAVDQFISCFLSKISDLGLSPSSFEVEVTETAFLNPGGFAIQALSRLQGYGVRLALDDFGSGYSGLGILHALSRADIKISRIKIDRVFVRDIATNASDRALVKAALMLSQMLGAELLAEGVENEQQLRILQQLGVSRFQGYYFCKPLSLDELVNLCSSASAPLSV